jgi:hypothetical protein
MSNNKEVLLVLQEGKNQNLIKPCFTYNICLVPQINTANQILYLIKENNNEIDLEQIKPKLVLHINTIKVYMSVLTKLKYIERIKPDYQTTVMWIIK